MILTRIHTRHRVNPIPLQLQWLTGLLGLLIFSMPGLATAQFSPRLEMPPVTHGSLSTTPSQESGALSQLFLLLNDHPRLAVVAARTRAAEARIPSARKPADPQLQLGLMNYTIPEFAPMDPTGMVQLQIMQMVPLGHKLSLAGELAEAEAAVEASEIGEVRAQLQAELAGYYYDLAAIDLALKASQESIRLMNEVSLTVEARYRAGGGRQVDLLRARTEIARMVGDTIRIQSDREAILLQLNALLNRSLDTPVTPELTGFPAALPSLKWLDSVAIGSRSMIQSGRLRIDAAAAAQSLADRNLAPDLEVGVQYGFRRGMSANGGMATEGMWSVMVGSSIPIFARSRQIQERDEMRSLKQAAEFELENAIRVNRGLLGQALAQLGRIRALDSLYHDQIVPQAEATAESALAEYRIGGTDFTSVVEARLAVNRYRQEAADIRGEEGKAWASLALLTGISLPQLLADISAGLEASDANH